MGGSADASGIEQLLGNTAVTLTQSKAKQVDTLEEERTFFRKEGFTAGQIDVRWVSFNLAKVWIDAG